MSKHIYPVGPLGAVPDSVDRGLLFQTKGDILQIYDTNGNGVLMKVSYIYVDNRMDMVRLQNLPHGQVYAKIKIKEPK